MHDEDETGGGRVTLARVAKEAGVSMPTVSKVLNGRTDVSRATRAKVVRLLDVHGYRRRAQPSSRSPLIDIVFHELESIWAMELIRGVENVAKENRATVVLTESGTRHTPAPEWLPGVLRRRPLGVVLVRSSLPGDIKHRLRAAAIPFAVIDPAGDADPDVPSVGSANWAGGLAATRHLTGLGDRQVAIITGPKVQRGFAHAMELLEGPERPTAVFAGSDLQALGVLEAARVKGLRVPEDLSVVGYDDVPPAQWSSPPLTTVHQPLRHMAEEAARTLLRPDVPGTAAQRIDISGDQQVKSSA
ncbi:LacI family DNA-binding transcriptional regulator [Streptomyces sp. NPDC093250]|uniref:LacI family DNA-binding transcriptional regulator n=1 Tax=Streptomyces sp. NPDC093250 TaxID=3366036 RepID=UPI0038004131